MDLQRIYRSAPYRYKVYSVLKRSGAGRRVIAQPARELKVIQTWITREELSGLPVHVSATAYKHGSSIKKNAAIHVKNNYILKMDFFNFFPSITPSDLAVHIDLNMPGKYLKNEVDFISRVLFWYPHGNHRLQLCVGGPGSPFISNTVMFDFDKEVSDACIEMGISYTRYADDMTFSTNESGVLTNVKVLVGRLLSEVKYPRLRLNEDKTIWTSKKHHRSVTGLVLSSQGHLSLGRARKRHIRSMIHRFSMGRLETQECKQLRGLLAFAKDVEPSFITSLINKYSREVIIQIQRFSETGDY
jgi:RNA-directed DNA polymerase